MNLLPKTITPRRLSVKKAIEFLQKTKNDRRGTFDKIQHAVLGSKAIQAPNSEGQKVGVRKSSTPRLFSQTCSVTYTEREGKR